MTRTKFEERIIVNIIIEAFGAHAETADNFSLMQRFFSAGDNPLLYQIDDAVSKSLRVNTQISFIGQIGKNRIGNSPHACLKGGFIINQIGNQLSYRPGNMAGSLQHQLQKRRVIFHESGNLTHVNKAVSQCSGHVRIYFRHHIRRRFRSRLGDIHGNTEANITVGVRGGYGNQSHIDGERTSLH